jgi:hypothetical protein
MIFLLPHSLAPSPVSKLSLSRLLTGEWGEGVGGVGGGGAISYDSEKAMSSINHSVLIQVSEQTTFQKTFEMMNTNRKRKK